MAKASMASLHHEFGGGDATNVVALEHCDGCERQCGVTGVIVNEVEFSAGRPEVASGSAQTTVYVADSIDEFERLDLKDMECRVLDIGPITEPVEVDSLMGFALERVTSLVGTAGCIVEQSALIRPVE